MANFNLLSHQQKVPVREALPIYSVLGVIAAVTSMLLMAHVWMTQQKEELTAELASIEESLAQLAKGASAHPISTAYNTFAESTRDLFDGLAALNHVSACLTAIKRNKGEVHLLGNARSVKELSGLLHANEKWSRFAIDNIQEAKMRGIVFDLKRVEPTPIFLSQKRRHVK